MDRTPGTGKSPNTYSVPVSRVQHTPGVEAVPGPAPASAMPVAPASAPAPALSGHMRCPAATATTTRHSSRPVAASPFYSSTHAAGAATEESVPAPANIAKVGTITTFIQQLPTIEQVTNPIALTTRGQYALTETRDGKINIIVYSPSQNREVTVATIDKPKDAPSLWADIRKELEGYYEARFHSKPAEAAPAENTSEEAWTNEPLVIPGKGKFHHVGSRAAITDPTQFFVKLSAVENHKLYFVNKVGDIERHELIRTEEDWDRMDTWIKDAVIKILTDHAYAPLSFQPS